MCHSAQGRKSPAIWSGSGIWAVC